MRTREGRRGLLFICILAVVLLALLLLSFGYEQLLKIDA